MQIRTPTRSDLPDIKRVLEDTDLFPPDMLEEMIAPFFDGSEPAHWLVCEIDRVGVIGFSYARPEALTEGTWNLLAIGLRTAHQGKGYGAKLIHQVEASLCQERILIVETSGLDTFEPTCAFYAARGYTKEAVIRDYWAPGDDKIIFWKALTPGVGDERT